MSKIVDLHRKGLLTDQQVLIAYKFARDPNAFRLAPILHRILRELVIENESLEAYEKRKGWASRSAKVVLSTLLYALEEIGGSHLEDNTTDLKIMLEYMKADDIPSLGEPMQEFGLTHTEARLFLILYRAKERFCSIATLYHRLYSDMPDCDTPDLKIVQVYICKIRKKIERKWRIETVYNTGYKLVAVLPGATPEATALRWYSAHADGKSLRQIAREDGAEPSTVMRNINRLVDRYTDEEISAMISRTCDQATTPPAAPLRLCRGPSSA